MIRCLTILLLSICLLKATGINTGQPIIWYQVQMPNWPGMYFVETSTNLTSWQNLGAYTNEHPYVHLVDNSVRFFRAKPFLCSPNNPYYDNSYLELFATPITITQL